MPLQAIGAAMGVRMKNTINSPEAKLANLQRPEEFAAVEAVTDLVAVTYMAHSAFVLAELGVADALGKESQSATELATRVGADSGTLYRMLRLVATYGVFSEGADRRFTHTPMSRLFRSDHPQSHRDLLRLGATGVHLRILGGFVHALRTGRPAAEIAFPEGVFNYFANNPDESAAFDRAMTSKSHTEIAAVLHAYAFSRFETIADIGGGRGHLLEAVRTKHRMPVEFCSTCRTWWTRFPLRPGGASPCRAATFSKTCSQPATLTY